MSTSHNFNPTSGFTMIEVLIAIPILIVGLICMALLAARMMGGSRESRFMGLAASLTSEKIEDLTRFAFDDPQVCVTTGNATAGSLTADIVLNVTCPSGKAANVNYFDDVSLESTTGSISETVSAPGPVYTTTTHSPDGTMAMTASATLPGTATFHRRWIIEKDSPVANVRRLTVLVTLVDASVRPGVTFQMSIVRP
jgi:Tfp pilus assembly protein FimT